MEALEPEKAVWPIYVMVVEDEPLLRGLLAEELRESGLTVIEAASADEAISYMGAHPDIDLVFTDVHMPGALDGLGLAATLKMGKPYLPIIITSGNLTPAEVTDHGIFIAKPYRLADAVSLVFKSLGVQPRSNAK